MRNAGKKLVIAVFVASFGLSFGGSTALADEPNDNTFPGGTSPYYGTPSWYLCSSGSSGCGFAGGGMSISPSGDVDYLLTGCGNGTVTSVSILIQNGGGDLDMAVYKPNGTLIGSSTGTGTTETVSTSSAGMNAVVVKIYGYSGATGGYQLNIFCSA